MSETYFVPIFEREGNKLFVLQEDFRSDNEEEAKHAGMGAMLVECMLMKMKYTGEVKEIDPKSTLHARATIGHTPVAVIEGPLFDLYDLHTEAPE